MLNDRILMILIAATKKQLDVHPLPWYTVGLESKALSHAWLPCHSNCSFLVFCVCVAGEL